MFKKDPDPWVRTFTVSDPVRHKKGYTLYKVISKVFPKNSVEAVTQVTVWKRYNDFKNLHKALAALHQGLYLKGTFPTFAKAQIFGRFDDSVIEERRRCALELLEFTAKYPPLFTSQVFVKFFEGGQVTDLQSEPEEQCTAQTLLPIVVSVSTPTDDKPSEIEQNENEEIDVTLGGIWKHRQVADEISVSSHTDDDDRTTFTDDDPSKSTVSDLSEFDPLSELNTFRTNDYCKDWLLSAFESINSSKVDKNDAEEELIFPKPFSDIGELDIPCDNVTSSACNPESDTSGVDSSLKSTDESSHSPSLDLWLLPFMEGIKKLLCTAEQFERASNFPEAFTMYKKVIDVLLSEAKDEQCFETRQKIQKLASYYLKRAESIYASHLTQSSNKKGVFKPENISSLEETRIRRSMKDLAKYRVIGILSKVLLVLDVLTNITCVVKVLRKSPQPQQPDMPNIAPRNIDFIVQLYEVYETTDAIYLVLEYATGGRLWDYISSYLQRSPLTPTNGSTLTKGGNKANLNNVYSGMKFPSGKTPDKSNEQDSIPYIDSSPSNEVTAEIFPTSYAALFRNYAANIPSNNVSLAKCKTKNLSFTDDEALNDTCNIESEAQIKDDLLRNMNQINSGNSKYQEQTVKPKVTDWLNSFEKQQKNDISPSSSVDLHTFLNGSDGRKFLDQKDQPSVDNKSEIFPIGQQQCIKDQSQKKLGFTEVFHKMDADLSFACSKPTYLPESCIAFWIAEIIVALENLHKLGIIWKDFRPENVLLGSEGHILLSYYSQWNSVDCVVNEKAVQNFYAAPEVSNVFTVTTSCDWWSLGAILFELVTGKKLVSCYPSGITSHTTIHVPEGASTIAEDLIQKLLKANPSERLGSGVDGIGDIKCHPFFQFINWDSLKAY